MRLRFPTSLLGVLRCAAKEAGRFAIHGLRVHVRADGRALATVTDGRRLVTVELEHGEADVPATPGSWLLDTSDLRDALKVAAKAGTEEEGHGLSPLLLLPPPGIEKYAELELPVDAFMPKAPRVRWPIRILDGSFPDESSVVENIRAAPDAEMLIDARLLAAVARAAQAVAEDLGPSTVRLRVHRGEKAADPAKAHTAHQWLVLEVVHPNGVGTWHGVIAAVRGDESPPPRVFPHAKDPVPAAAAVPTPSASPAAPAPGGAP